MARNRPDPKVEALSATKTLNPHPERVADEAFGASEFFDARDLVQVKYEMVRSVKTGGASVSAAAHAFGLSRQSYYNAAASLAEEGLSGLLPGKPGPRGAHKLTDEVLDHLEAQRTERPDVGPKEPAASVVSRSGLTLQPRSRERPRHCSRTGVPCKPRWWRS